MLNCLACILAKSGTFRGLGIPVALTRSLAFLMALEVPTKLPFRVTFLVVVVGLVTDLTFEFLGVGKAKSTPALTKGELIAEAVWPLLTGVKFKILDLLFLDLLGELMIFSANRLTLAASISNASLSNNRLILEFRREEGSDAKEFSGPFFSSSSGMSISDSVSIFVESNFIFGKIMADSGLDYTKKLSKLCNFSSFKYLSTTCRVSESGSSQVQIADNQLPSRGLKYIFISRDCNMLMVSLDSELNCPSCGFLLKLENL